MRTTGCLVLGVMLLCAATRAADVAPTPDERKTIDALAKQAVEQRRLPHVWPSDDGNDRQLSHSISFPGEPR